MRLPTNFRRAVAAVAAPALFFALVACGSDKSEQAGDDATTASSSPAASESPQDSESASPGDEGGAPAEGEKVDTKTFLENIRTSMDSATTAHISMKMSASGAEISATGELDYTTKPPSMAMKMTMPTLGPDPIDLRLVDGMMYMNMGNLSQGKFYKFDLSDENSPLGDLSGLTDSMDPTAAFDASSGSLKSVTFVGDEDVDGETLAHYTMTMDTSKVKKLKGLGAAAGSSVPKQMTYDVWLDDQYRTRQMTMDLGSQGTIEMKAFDWDKPVDITAPPANKITEMPGMQGAA